MSAGRIFHTEARIEQFDIDMLRETSRNVTFAVGKVASILQVSPGTVVNVAKSGAFPHAFRLGAENKKKGNLQVPATALLEYLIAQGMFDHLHAFKQHVGEAPRIVAHKVPEDVALTSGQIAQILGMAPRTASKLIDAGKIHGYKINADRRATLGELVKYMESVGMPQEIIERAAPMRLAMFGNQQDASALNKDFVAPREGHDRIIATTNPVALGCILNRYRMAGVIINENDSTLAQIAPVKLRDMVMDALNGDAKSEAKVKVPPTILIRPETASPDADAEAAFDLVVAPGNASGEIHELLQWRLPKQPNPPQP